MAKGVKKISMTVEGTTTEIKTRQATLEAEKWGVFEVNEWLPNTTEAEKKEPVYWIRQSQDRKTILYKNKHKGYQFKIEKKYCGRYAFYIEASRSGDRDFKNQAGMWVNGVSKPLIVSSDWRKERDGADIKNGKPIAYGDIVYLWFDTEGLNGDTLIVEVYNKAFLKDTLIHVYTDVRVTEGETFLKIGNTSAWMGKVKHLDKEEKFYIKVKNARTSKYIKDSKGDDLHAIYLKVKNEYISDQIKPTQNLTPTKIFKPEVNSERYEPCKFDEIKITEIEKKDGKATPKTISVFKKGQGKKGKAVLEEISREIYFDFDMATLTTKASNKLNNILNFLLGHKGTSIHLSGYACVIGDKKHNQELSQERSDTIKDFFNNGGLDGRRIISLGKGEANVKDKDTIKNKDLSSYKRARRVDIKFKFSGHSAETISYETVAPSAANDKYLTLDVVGYETEACYREKDKHSKSIIINNVNISKIEKTGDSARFPIQSTLSASNIAPLQYLWPKWNLGKGIMSKGLDAANTYDVNVHSCRYYSPKDKYVLQIKAYPDIKWELALELLIDVSNYRAANMPKGNIYKRHQQKAMQDGYKKWLMNKQGKVPISVGFGLAAEWDGGRSKRSFTNSFATKMELLAKTIAKSADILQNAINYAQSAAKNTAIPVSFNIRYPKFTVVGSWMLEPNGKGKVGVVGTISFGCKPLIGAEVVIDIIGAAIAAVSYGGTGNPAVARLINQFRGRLEDLGAKVIFDATFYGELEIMVEALKIDAEKGIDMQGKTTIGGKMGVTIRFEIGAELGKARGVKNNPIIKFRAMAKADGYFGGDFVMDSDNKGIFIQPILKFSGVMLTAEIEGEIGWWKSNFKIERRVVEGESYSLGKKYVIEN